MDHINAIHYYNMHIHRYIAFSFHGIIQTLRRICRINTDGCILIYCHICICQFRKQICHRASYVERAKAEGHKVIMIGDGINDSPALSAADIGIAISDGAEIAREIADITVGADNLNELITLRKISTALTRRIRRNYRTIVGFNTGLIVLGVAGVIQPTTSALMHNTSTLAIGLHSMKDLVL